jgi:hypothetical protein
MGFSNNKKSVKYNYVKRDMGSQKEIKKENISYNAISGQVNKIEILRKS